MEKKDEEVRHEKMNKCQSRKKEKSKWKISRN